MYITCLHLYFVSSSIVSVCTVAWLVKSNVNSSLLKHWAPSSRRRFRNTTMHSNVYRHIKRLLCFGWSRLQNFENHYLRRQNENACTEYEASNNTLSGVGRRKRKMVWTILNNEEESVNAIHTKRKKPKVVTFYSSVHIA